MVVILLIAAATCWFCWSKERSTHPSIKDFIRDYRCLAPTRYSYWEIKKMTNFFRDKIGQGGFGGVYRGRLPNGLLVAVKILNSTKGNGEDFINEVASIGRTSHVNIVELVGFCIEGRKKALIYEFMANGSLEKFIRKGPSPIVHRQLAISLLYQIAAGVAQGLCYLHRGCSIRILHFDIKPHNILLDEDFVPKISDFGLAKLCSSKESIISMMDTRGTIGYLAPEMIYRTFGGISHKSDVYSYGMMILEMVGGRNNTDVRLGHSSDIYFPDWIYKRLELGNDLGHVQYNMTTEEKEIAKKMIIVGLWCIQTNPSHRPSMKEVINMLEGSLDSLQIPPKPFSTSPRSPRMDISFTIDSSMS